MVGVYRIIHFIAGFYADAVEVWPEALAPRRSRGRKFISEPHFVGFDLDFL